MDPYNCPSNVQDIINEVKAYNTYVYDSWCFILFLTSFSTLRFYNLIEIDIEIKYHFFSFDKKEGIHMNMHIASFC